METVVWFGRPNGRPADPSPDRVAEGRRTVEAASQQRIRATLRAALNQAIKERKIDLNVASLVELEGGKRPKALIWTEERVAAWQETFTLHVAETEARKRLFAAVDGGSRHGKTANALDACIGAPRPSVVMVWTPKQIS